MPEASDFVAALLRDPTASHLLEALVHCVPEKAFRSLWSTYFQGSILRLAVHPVANFVVAKALERLNAHELSKFCEEITPVLTKIVGKSRHYSF